MCYHIGQTIEDRTGRPVLGTVQYMTVDGQQVATGPQWYVMRVAPLADFQVVEVLKGWDFIGAWSPTETIYKTCIGSRRKKKRKKRICPGYVFACTDRRVAWDLLGSRSNGKILGVVGRDGRPIAVPAAQMAAVRNLPKAVRRLYASEAVPALEPTPIVSGSKVVAKGAPDFIVFDVKEVNAGIAKVLWPMFGGIEKDMPISDLVRQQDIVR